MFPLLFESPKKYRSSLRKNQVLFRHPWVGNGTERGQQFCKGVGALDKIRRAQLQVDLDKLLTAAPLSKENAPKGLDGKVLDWYFDPLKPLVAIECTGEGPVAHGVKIENDDEMKVGLKYLRRIAELENECAILKRERIQLRSQVDELTQALGHRGDFESEATLSECYTHWKSRLRCKSEEQRVKILRLSNHVVNGLGLTTKWCELTRASIVAAIDKSSPKTEHERYARTQAFKRFCRDICLPKEEDGLGFIKNPGKTLQAGSAIAIQQRRIAGGTVNTLDPCKYVKDRCAMPLYWKAMVATLGFGGLRLSEAAGLLWEDIDFKKKLIRVRSNDVHPGLKTDSSHRPIRPIPNFWKVLAKFRKAVPGDRLVFERKESKSGSWFDMFHGKPRCIELSKSLADVLESYDATGGEYARRLRRWWETTMRKNGYTELAAFMGGHSSAVGARHYTDWEHLALKACIKPA
jgi:integrase